MEEVGYMNAHAYNNSQTLDNQARRSGFMTRAEYEERGEEGFFKTHAASNVFTPTPPPPPPPEPSVQSKETAKTTK